MKDSICQFLEWDSEFFGYRIARVNTHQLDPQSVEVVNDWCKSQEIDCLYFLANTDDPATIRQVEREGFNLVEVRLKFERKTAGWDPATRPKASEGIQIRPAKEDDIPILQDIATNSYINTRYYVDEHFSEEKCQELYRIWVKRSCQGHAQMALVAETDGQIQGYITGYRNPESTDGQFDLTGVRNEVRRSGIGHELFRSGLDWYVKSGVEYILVVTQGRNVPTQRMIQRYGFITRKCQLYYHKWYNH